MHNDEVHDSYYSLNIIREQMSLKTSWTGLATCMREKKVHAEI